MTLCKQFIQNINPIQITLKLAIQTENMTIIAQIWRLFSWTKLPYLDKVTCLEKHPAY